MSAGQTFEARQQTVSSPSQFFHGRFATAASTPTVSESGFTWSAEQRFGWRTQDGRGGFLFHFLHAGPVKWLCVRVLGWMSQGNTASMAVVSAQDVQSFLLAVVTPWIMQRSHTHTDISTDKAHTHTQPHTHIWMCRLWVCEHFEALSQKHICCFFFRKIMWFWLFFLVKMFVFSGWNWICSFLHKLWCFFVPCRHILTDLTVIMTWLLVMTKAITWWTLQDPVEWINV